MIDFQALVGAHPSRPFRHQAARILPRQQPKTTRRLQRHRNPPDPQPMQRKHKLLAHRSHCCRKQIGAASRRRVLLASLLPSDSRRLLLASLLPHQIPAPPPRPLNSDPSLRDRPIRSHTTGARRGSAAAGSAQASRMAALTGATSGTNRGARRRYRRRWGRVAASRIQTAPGSPRELRHLPSRPDGPRLAAGVPVNPAVGQG